MKLHIIGLGGIGSHLLLPLMQYLNYENNKMFESVIFIDGDKYEEKNLKRQHVVSMENKAEAQTKYYRELFENIVIQFIDKYVTAENISKIIHNEDVVLLCVDNHKTRKLLEDYSDEVENITIISGGNELYDGNVMIMQKLDGQLITPKFSEMHEELKNPTDKSPDEISCDELTESAPQISIVNATIADIMRRTLFAMMRTGINYYETFVNCNTGGMNFSKFKTIGLEMKRLKIGDQDESKT